MIDVLLLLGNLDHKLASIDSQTARTNELLEWLGERRAEAGV